MDEQQATQPEQTSVPADYQNQTPGGWAPPSSATPPPVSAAPPAAGSPPAAAGAPAAEDGSASEGGAPTSGSAPAPAPQRNPFAASYFSALRALGGADTAQVVRDPQTGQVTGVHIVSASPGDQMKRILASFAAGVAATPGPGPGGATRALAAGAGAGIQQGQQRQKEMQQNVDQANDYQDRQQKKLMQQAQSHLLDIQTAAQSFRMAREKTDAAFLDGTRLNDFNNFVSTNGGQEIGTAKDMAGVAELRKQYPDLYKDSVGARTVVTPNIEDGQVTGMKVAVVPGDWGTQRLTEAQPLPIIQPDGTVKTQTIPAGSMSNQQYADHYQAALQPILKRQEQESVEQRETKLEGMRQSGENARQDKELAAKKLLADDPQIASLGEAIANGSLTEDQIPGFSKNKTSIEAYLAQHHPNLDQKSVMLDAGQRKQVNLATNAIHNLDTINSQLQRRPDLLGVINGRISAGKELTGTNDPDLAAINTELDNYALASTGAHGIRAVQARADAKKALLNGFKNGPQGVAASTQAARMSLQNLASAGKPRGTDGNPYVYRTGQGAPDTSSAIPARPAGVPATATYIQDSKGHTQWVNDINAARKVDPNLKVIGQ